MRRRQLTLALANAILRGLFAAAYRVRAEGLEHVEAAGARCLIAPQHVSAIDSLVVRSRLKTAPVLAVNPQLVSVGWMRRIMEVCFARYHPLAATNPLAIRDLAGEIRDGHAVMVFPEGRMSVTGSLMRVYEGAALIAELADAFVVPVRLEGLYSSRFSRRPAAQGERRWFPRVRVRFFPPRKLEIDPTLKGRGRREAAGRAMHDIMSDMIFESLLPRDDIVGVLGGQARSEYGRRGLFGDGARDVTPAALYRQARHLTVALDRHFVAGSTATVIGATGPRAVALHCAMQTAGISSLMIDPELDPGGARDACATANVTAIIATRSQASRAKAIASATAGLPLIWLEDLEHAKAHPSHKHRVHGARTISFVDNAGGKPQVVAHSNRSICAVAAQILARLDIHAADVVLNLAPPHSALGLSIAANLPLLACARTISPPSGQTAPDIARQVYLNSATVLFATASALESLAEKADPYELRSIRHLVCVDAGASASLRTLFSDRFGLRVLQSYSLGERVPLAALSTPLYFDLHAFGRLLPGTRATPSAGGACKSLWFSGPATAAGLYLGGGRLAEAPEPGWMAHSVMMDDAGFLRAASSPRGPGASEAAAELATID